MDELDSVVKKMDDDSSLNRPRVEAIEEFLISIYDYFDRVGIIIEDKSKYQEKEKREIKLIGIMRVYTEETLINLRKTR
jgi:hypothetical protein